MGLAIVIAAAGFTVLTASASSSRLQTVGTVQAHARTVYDILVRPRRAQLKLEQTQGLVQPGFLAGVYGGIGLDQWQQIKALPGISVAAPIAMVGYVVLPLQLNVDMRPALPASGDGVARMDVTWSYDNGLSTVVQSPDFAYLTSQRLPLNQTASGGFYRQPDRGPSAPTICPDYSNGDQSPDVSRRHSTINCFSRVEGGQSLFVVWPYGLVGQQLAFPLPVVLAAVDPQQEDALDGLDRAVTSGRPLPGAPLADSRTMSGQAVPVLAGQVPATGVTATVRLSKVGSTAAAVVTSGAGPDRLRPLPHVPVSSRTITAAAAYQTLLTNLANPRPDKRSKGDDGLAGNIYTYATVSSPRVDDNGRLADAGRPIYRRGFPGTDPFLVPGASDLQVRAVRETARYDDAGSYPTPATLIARGTFDPAKLSGLSDLSAQILSGYATAPTSGADARNRQLLGGKALAPSPNIGGLVQPPPLMLTTLDALPQLTQGGWDPSNAAAPISAVRVRVAGVSGVDPLSREKVRLAAQRISQATGLQVDVTVGSSPTARTLQLPAGRFGRPELALSQWWLKKGVAVAILKAVDKKSLILFVLVLLVCALSVANSAVASVRARRTELGVLACVGWHRRHLFTVVLTELTLVAVAAGVLAAVAALSLGAVFGTSVSITRAALAVPAALLVALAAGLFPAWLATQAEPMEAVRPAVSVVRSSRTPTGAATLGLVNLARTRARVAVSASGLTVAVAAFTLLLAITVAFQGAVVGTLLGDAVAVQARGADYAATFATLLLAGVGVANVLYLNIRDRGAEIATLRAVGWRESNLARMVLAEGLGIALVGSVPGAVLGLAASAILAGGVTPGIVGAAALGVCVGVLVAMAGSAVPVVLLRRLPTALLLTEE